MDGRGAEAEAATAIPLLVRRGEYDHSAGVRIARLKALGNAIVPQVAAEFMRVMPEAQ
jgi:phosphoserine phosphatase